MFKLLMVRCLSQTPFLLVQSRTLFFLESHFLNLGKRFLLLSHLDSVSVYRSWYVRSRKISVNCSLWRHQWISRLRLLMISNIKPVKVEGYHCRNYYYGPEILKKNCSRKPKATTKQNDDKPNFQGSFFFSTQPFP